MDKLLNGKYIKKPIHQNKGFSLIEVWIVILVISVVIIMVSTQFPIIENFVHQLMEISVFEKQYYLFLILLERDYQESEEVDAFLDQPVFLKNIEDKNSEKKQKKIVYDWNPSKKEITKKIDLGSPQTLVRGVIFFSWEKVKESPICHQLKIKSIFSKNERIYQMCYRLL